MSDKPKRIRSGDAAALFELEAELRESAMVYASWQNHGNGTKDTDRKATDGARLRLRKAALAYAALVRVIETP